MFFLEVSLKLYRTTFKFNDSTPYIFKINVFRGKPLLKLYKIHLSYDPEVPTVCNGDKNTYLVKILRNVVMIYRGKDVSIENLHQGFTHVFESTFESTEGIATYISHPAHVEFATAFLDQLEKVLVIDYKPTTVDP